MSTEEQPVTKIPEEKIKNPKRVAQGKKLAEISKAAKERKRANLAETKSDTSSESFQIPSLTTSISIVGAVTGVIGTYIAWKSFSSEKNGEEERTKPFTEKKTTVKYNNLDDDDI